MNSDLSALALFGTVQPVSSKRELRAGGWSCVLCDGQLQGICWHGIEVVRGISYLLRDRNWGTVEASITDLEVEHSPQGFEVRFQLRMPTEHGCLSCHAYIRADQSGTLTFEVVAQPDGEIWTNRCGFVVLHPAAVSGLALQVTHTDGRTEETRFPEEISPSQPVFDIRALGYQPTPGIELEIRLDAQLPMDPAGKFEMEDQRNWSDASFKTYVASLQDSWPYALPAHQPLRQQVHLKARGEPSMSAAKPSGESPVALGEQTACFMPALGVGVPAGLSCAHAEEVKALRALGARWWQVELDLRDRNLEADIQAIVQAQKGLAVCVQGDVIAPDAMSASDAASRVADLCSQYGLNLDAIRFLPAALLQSFQPSDQWPDVPSHEAYVLAARTFFPAARVGSGVFTSFTELNRKRPIAEGMDFIGHLTCPIVHAPDDLSVMQTRECLPHIERSIRTHWPSVPYRLGPSTLAPRRNPYGSGTASNLQGVRMALADQDPRHNAAFGSAWVVAYAASLAFNSLEVLTLLESHGPNGPLGGFSATPITQTNAKAWTALCSLMQASDRPLWSLHGLPVQVSGLAWRDESTAVHVLLANTSADHVSLTWDPAWTDQIKLPREMNPFEVLEFKVSF